MLRDLALAAKAACSHEDQETLIPLVQKLRDLGEIGFKRGLLSLEGELAQIKDPLLKLGLQLIVDTAEPEILPDILDSDMYYNGSNGRELLKKSSPGKGVLRIQVGDNARSILICTKIFLGEIGHSRW